MNLLFAIALGLPPAAHKHNERAMDHDEAGRLAEAEAALVAAYASMPDPRDDLEGREQVTASLRSVLNRAYEANGEPGPLCRLRAHLRAHVDGLRAAFLDQPGPIELTGNEERLADVDGLLAAFPPGTCDPPPPSTKAMDAPAPPVGADSPPQAPVTGPAPAAPVAADSRARRLTIVGGVGFALTGVALGVMTYGLARERREVAAGRDLDSVLADRPATPTELADLHEHLDSARVGRQLALAGGISSAIFLTAAVALFAMKARTKSKSSKMCTRRNAVQMAPWGSRHGAGLLLRIALP